jgi:hypothetical protein
MPSAAHGFPGVSVSGDPTPPVWVNLNYDYYISVTVYTTVGETAVTSCWAESNSGTINGPDWSGAWNATPTYSFSGGGQSGIHTFDVVNINHGIYVYWRGAGTASSPNPIPPGRSYPAGYFYTP